MEVAGIEVQVLFLLLWRQNPKHTALVELNSCQSDPWQRDKMHPTTWKESLALLVLSPVSTLSFYSHWQINY